MEGEGLDICLSGEVSMFFGLFSRRRRSVIRGFYATRYIEAPDADAAIELVQFSIRNELAQLLKSGGGSMDALVQRVDEILVVERRHVDANASGFTFF